MRMFLKWEIFVKLTTKNILALGKKISLFINRYYFNIKINYFTYKCFGNPNVFNCN